MPDNLTNPTPQFSTAEYAATSSTEHCKSCNQTLGSQFYRVNGALACAHCAEQLKLRMPQDSHQAFVRGLVFGIGGAILGLVLYAAFGILTGLVIGYVSLAVGYVVGKAMMKGSNGIGGRRYQVAAVILTYAAVSMAAIPIGISQYAKQNKQHPRPFTNRANPGTAAIGSPEQPSQDNGATDQDESQQPSNPATTKMGLGAALVGLAIAGLASPFLELQDPVHGVIGLIILLVGIRIAWRLTQGVKVDILGPFKTAAPTAKADASS